MARFRQIGCRRKGDGSLVTEADLASQRAIRSVLEERWPGTGFLGEEMSEAQQASAIADQGRPLWVLDPLDGTTNFTAGMPFFSISLALLEGGVLRFGMVLDPVREECFWAEAGGGAWLNGERLQLDPHSPATMDDGVAVVDYKRLPAELACALVTRPPCRSLRSLGSVALEWCWLAAGRCSLYLHGRQSLWDYAAGRLIHSEAGGAALGEIAIGPELIKRNAVAAANAGLLEQWQCYLEQAGGDPLQSAG